MTDGLFGLLFPPILLVIMITLTGVFVMSRVRRYGRVFNWPPVPEKSGPPADRK